jgi:hypothetical protein
MTTLREFGFNDICDLFEAMRAEIVARKFAYKKKRENMIIREFKLSEFGV